MLKELFSPVFVEKGKQRPHIKFRRGLNVILGVSTSENSIGKSSALLAIDFAFGGGDYYKGDIVSHTGQHDIFFCFSFDGKDYYFARNTDTHNKVDICDSNYYRTDEEWPLEKFRSWLKEKYCIDKIELSFRGIVGVFFRIYGKSNNEERNPLLAHKSESKAIAVHRMIRLFDQENHISKYEKELDTLKEKIETLSKSFKHGFIKQLSGGKKSLESNEIEIYRLKAELKNLPFEHSEKLNEEEIKKATLKEQIKKRILQLETEIAALMRKLNLINLGIDYGLSPDYEDFNELQEFFPNVDLRKIHEIEKYHKKLAEILNKQFLQEKKTVEENLKLLEEKLSRKRKKLADFGISEDFSKEFLEKYSEIQGRINALEQQNYFYELRQRLANEKKMAEEKLNRQTRGLLSEIESRLNNQMKAYNDTLYMDLHKPPQLKFNGRNDYEFGTPDDTGTGSNYKGLVLYDLAVLANSVLPAVVHDSFILKNISANITDGLIKIYNQSDKQIFIAFDRLETFSDETQKIIESRKVLVLADNGCELYGDCWNKVKK